MKKFLKFFIVLITVVLFVSPITGNYETTVSAEEISKEIKVVNGVLTIELDSKEEEEIFLSELEKHNAYSQNLWEKALAKSDDGIVIEAVQGSVDSNLNNIQPTALALAKVKGNFFIGINYILLDASVSYDKVNNKFGTIYGTDLYGRTDINSVSNVVTKYTKKDSNRTLGVNSTYRLTVHLPSGSTKKYSVQSYYEFYASTNTGYWLWNES